MDLSKLPNGQSLAITRQLAAECYERRLLALIDAMRPYLGHKASCHRMNCNSVAQYCTCGLEALLAHIQEPQK